MGRIAASAMDIVSVRKQFPALQGKQIYFDNAGGSQILKASVDSISSYLLDTNVQLGASYPISQKSTARYSAGIDAAAHYINAPVECVVLGPSTTQLFRNLSLALFDYITPESEIIVSKLDHEANIASWVQLAAWKNCTLIWWAAENASNPQLDPQMLRRLMTNRTKLVACTHTSNILGTITDIKAVAEVVHSVPGALLCVDAVAYAPHRAVDVVDLGIDFYAFSWYKVYGPHVAMMYGSPLAKKALRSLGHFFKGSQTLEDLLGLAGASYELTAAIPPVCTYLANVSWATIEAQEQMLQAVLLDYLTSKPGVFRIWGEPTADPTKRVPVISFTVVGRKSKDVVDAIEARSNFACRWGSFYSNRLVQEVLGLDPSDGVVRVSMVHYNSADEIKSYVTLLDEIILGDKSLPEAGPKL